MKLLFRDGKSHIQLQKINLCVLGRRKQEYSLLCCSSALFLSRSITIIEQKLTIWTFFAYWSVVLVVLEGQSSGCNIQLLCLRIRIEPLLCCTTSFTIISAANTRTVRFQSPQTLKQNSVTNDNVSCLIKPDYRYKSYLRYFRQWILCVASYFHRPGGATFSVRLSRWMPNHTYQTLTLIVSFA